MEEDQHVFMEVIPEIYPTAKANESVMKLKKCLYEIPHSGRQFSRVVEEHMEELVFPRLSADRCVNVKANKAILVLSYVDIVFA